MTRLCENATRASKEVKAIHATVSSHRSVAGRRRSSHATILLTLACAAGCADGQEGEGIPPELEDIPLARAGDGGPRVLAAYASRDGFDSLPAPRSGDWRLGPGRDEEPQSFLDYAASSPVRATEEQTRIVLVPIGSMGERGDEILSSMRRYGEIFFGCRVDVGEAAALPEKGRRVREDGRHRWSQHLTGVLMEEVLIPRLPRDAIVLLGITMADLYPDPDWNYVFGQANLRRRVGVYSLVRYAPEFWGEEDTPEARSQTLRRACQVFAHETCHMFSMEHCLHFSCAMNGSNSLDESDRQPLWLCPVCASKLSWNRGLDPLARYRGLAGFFREVGLEEIALWHEKRAEALAANR
ncbi:MAG: hypothetical protein HY720_09420 [Planctomycetes bacterium]|nr:hypothetical protein [Planctomycetota bacterium]